MNKRIIYPGGYVSIVNEKGYKVLEHRHVWEKYKGKIPEGHHIHHINGNKEDNRLENLECLSSLDHRKKHLLPGRIRIKYPSGNTCVRKAEVIRLNEGQRAKW